MFENKTALTRIFLALAAVESGLTIYILGAIPAESENAALFGFSTSRLLALTIIALVLCALAALLARLLLSPAFARDALENIASLFAAGKKSAALDALAWLFFVAGILFLLSPDRLFGEALYQRAVPIVILGMAFALQTLIFKFLWNQNKINRDPWTEWSRLWTPIGVALGVLALLWVFIGATGIGAAPEKAGWYPPGTPVLPQQVLIAWGAGFLFFVAGVKSRFRTNPARLDSLLALLLWLGAAAIWLMQPMERLSYFTTNPTPPNFESYPYSDAALYDTFAQNYLIGASRQVGLTHRPLYSIFLAFLHALTGPHFDWATAAQVVILASFPAGLYLLASKVGGRRAAVFAALLAIFREQNAIALTNVIEVSHSKLLMSDLPTTALIIWFVYFWGRWDRDGNEKDWLGVIAGAFLGFAILVRSQAQLLIPVILPYIALVAPGGWKSKAGKTLVFLCGLCAVVAPWVWRNYQISGRVIVEYHDFYTRVIASGYTDSPDAIEQLPGETVEEYNRRMVSLIAEYIREHPAEVSRFYASYFLHNEISSVVYLPMALKFSDARAYVRDIGIWDARDPFGIPPLKSLPLFVFALFMVAVGIGVAYRRARWAGVAPLLLHFSYSLSVVPFRTSGWRFILPVDWISALYFSIGLMYLSRTIFLTFSQRGYPAVQDPLPAIRAATSRGRAVVLTLGAFAVVGIAFPLVEWAIPPRYPPMDSRALIEKNAPAEIRLDTGGVITTEELQLFLEREASAVALYGRSLYPSFYESGVFWGDDDTYSPDIRNISRLQFFLIGPAQETVFIPMDGPPPVFSHASDVLIIGCREESGVRALAVRTGTEPVFVSSAPWPGLTCPNP